MPKLIYPQLSYQVVSALFTVYNELKYGHKEKVYQKALVEEFTKREINFKRELYFPIRYNGKLISCYYYDFLVEDKIVVELKVAKDFYEKDINQLLAYLKFANYRLGILALFCKDGIKQKRIAN